MTAHSVLYMPSVFKRHRLKPTEERQPLDLPKEMWRTPLCYMLCMALLGLHFFPILLVILAMLVKAWKNDRYNFAIMLFLLFGTFAMYTDSLFPVKPYDLGLVTGVGCFLVLKKNKILTKVSLLYFAYVAAIIFISTFSSESFSVQFFVMRYYFSFISLFIPLAVFANRDFDIMYFFRKFMVFFLIMCIFYILDGFVLKGYIFVPGTFISSGNTSTFYSPYLTPFKLMILRKYPPGMLMIGVVLLPLARYYRLRTWQILTIILAAISTLTFSYIMAVLICLILFQGSVKKVMRYAMYGFIGILLAVGVDFILPYNKAKGESTLRIRSSFEQFSDLASMVDDEDLAKFGSGRMAQALPILELITNEDKRWTGLGFLHPEKTTSLKFIIEPEYFSDVTQAERVATDVEIVPVQLFIHMGWCGIILQTLFFLALYLIVRKMRYRSVYLAAALFCFLVGLAGFGSVNSYLGMSIVTMSYAAVLMANKQEEKALEKKTEPHAPIYKAD